MKEVSKKDLPDVSGGVYQPDDSDGGCIPAPGKNPHEIDLVYPSNPVIQGPEIGA